MPNTELLLRDRTTPERIRQGLATGEFLLHYQPKVDMRQGTVVGVEALIRWNHPVHGLLQPDAFIKQIADDDVVQRMGSWAIHQALDQAAVWFAVGLKISVSVNITPRELVRFDFPQRIDASLKRHPQLPRGTLALEVLETSAIDDPGEATRAIAACAALGVPVALDDFGTGYSSLTYLRHLPVAALKVDQSFVRGILNSSRDRAIVRGLLVMAEGLGLEAIAEGVESVEHVRALVALGCSLGQGYGIAKPMPPDDLPDWITAFQAAPPWDIRAAGQRVAVSLG